MEHLPKLQFLNCPYTLHVAAQKFKERESTSMDKEFRRLPLMNLRYDECKDTAYEKGDLAAAIKICPSVVSVKISYGLNDGNFTDEELKSLLKLKNLRHLCLESIRRLSFKGGILPVLEKFGSSTLEKLRLQYLSEVDVSAIAKCCSNLRSLSLGNIVQFISPSRPLKPQDNRLRSLEVLKMMQCNDKELIRQQPTAADILILLSSPALVALKFFEFDDLTDQLMEEAAHLYGFPNLKELQMEYCEGITGSFIECLLTLDNPFHACRMEPWNDKILKKLKSQVKTNNLDLSFAFC